MAVGNEGVILASGRLPTCRRLTHQSRHCRYDLIVGLVGTRGLKSANTAPTRDLLLQSHGPRPCSRNFLDREIISQMLLASVLVAETPEKRSHDRGRRHSNR